MINESTELLNDLVQEDEQYYFTMKNLKSITIIGDNGRRYCAKNLDITPELKQLIESSIIEERKKLINKIKKLSKSIDNEVQKW